MHENANIAYTRVLEAHPELASGLADAVSALSMPPVESLFLTGGIPLGAYCPGESDVDLVAIVSELFCEAELRETVRSVWAALPNASLMLIQRADLSEEEPEALAV